MPFSLFTFIGGSHGTMVYLIIIFVLVLLLIAFMISKIFRQKLSNKQLDRIEEKLDTLLKEKDRYNNP